MKNNKKLTLKSLQEQIEAVKVTKAKAKVKEREEPKTTDLKTTSTGKVQELKLHMKSSLFYLYAVSWILFLAKKIPILSKLALLLKLTYGRTSFWKLLIIARKLFIIVNAIIGVYAVLKLTGMNHESFMAGFVGMGYTYVDIFNNFIKRLFHWFFDLFDYKVVPNFPSNKPDTSWWPGPRSIGWNSKPMVDNGFMDMANNAKDWYKSPFNLTVESRPWYKDLSTWLYIGGGILGIVTIVGLAYIGYSYYDAVYGRSTPPTLPDNLPGNGPALPPDNGDNPPTIVQSIGTFFSSIQTSTQRALNPYNWWNSIVSNFHSEAQQRAFRNSQNNINTMDNRFYPFTPIDPTAPWYHRARIAMFGESNNEIIQRMRDRDFAWRDLIALQVNQPGITSGAQTPGGLGLGLRYESGIGYTDWAQPGSSFDRTRALIESLPQTPRNIPSPLPETISMAEEWSTPPTTEEVLAPVIEDVVAPAVTEYGDPRSFTDDLSHFNVD